MTTALFGLCIAVFLATMVEATEAFTIVFAVGNVRGWRCALQGAATALALLATFVIAGGLPLVRFVPIHILQLVIGLTLTYLGITWGRKAILRASGRKKLHDEDAIYADTVQSLKRNRTTGFTVAFNGVMVEGAEVLLIIVGLGGASHHLGLAGMAAGVAIALVMIVGAIVAKQLSRVPESQLKLAVSVLLLSYGLFWVGEGCGLQWPAADASLLGLVGIVALGAYGAVRMLKGYEGRMVKVNPYARLSDALASSFKTLREVAK